jgi:uncharacterized iron-regulated membrane protein
MKLLSIHRWISITVVLFTLYLTVTGTLIELVDLKGLLLRSSPYDANLQAMRGDVNGPGEYAMIGPAYYLSPSLPPDLDYPATFTRALEAARAAAGNTPLRYLELRQDNDHVVAIAQLDDRKPHHTALVFDAVSGARLPGAEVPEHNVESRESLRIVVKSLHRMTTFGNWALWINVAVGAGLITLIVTGVWIYVKQYRARSRVGRKALFWKAQDWWRTLHRTVSVACALFLSILVCSGLWLAFESLVFGYYLSDEMAQAQATGRPPAFMRDHMTALPEQQLAQLAQVVLKAYGAEYPGIAPRAVRLRVFAGYAQGVVISGETEARQLVYNARTGAAMLETEPGYPEVGFPFGWQAHQWAKQVHNGSMLGLTGRAINLLAGLALFYLSVSGIVMYLKLWRRRAVNGRRALVW